mgnify:CR=1 FL=1
MQVFGQGGALAKISPPIPPAIGEARIARLQRAVRLPSRVALIPKIVLQVAEVKPQHHGVGFQGEVEISQREVMEQRRIPAQPGVDDLHPALPLIEAALHEIAERVAIVHPPPEGAGIAQHQHPPHAGRFWAVLPRPPKCQAVGGGQRVKIRRVLRIAPIRLEAVMIDRMVFIVRLSQPVPVRQAKTHLQHRHTEADRHED